MLDDGNKRSLLAKPLLKELDWLGERGKSDKGDEHEVGEMAGTDGEAKEELSVRSGENSEEKAVGNPRLCESLLRIIAFEERSLDENPLL